MKIGIFLGYGPQVKLGKEGLGRYIGGLLKGFQEQNHDITVACPFWLKDTLYDLMNSFFIDVKRINIVTTTENPALWKIYCFLTLPKQSKNLKKKVMYFFKYMINLIFKKFGKANSILEIGIWTIIFIAVSVVAVMPLILIIGCYILKKCIFLLKKVFKLAYRGDWQLQLFHIMTENVLTNLVNSVNVCTKQDVWFVPAIFWPQVNNINGTVVINAPDLVSQEFPHGFSNVYNADIAIKDCRETMMKGKYFITYSEYLRKNLIEEQYGKKASNSISIGHANNDMLPYLKIDINKKSDIDWEDIFAKNIIAKYFENNIKYVFYASQIRPNKNILNLVKAFEYLIRRKFVYHKLYITADLSKNSEIRDYIIKNSLEDDIISIFNVPAQTLAALYHCADLVVNPTLYEGGFPFTFGEGMSVGTPSIMSDIPQVRDVLEPAGLEEIMFDPYDWRAIADKIEWALSDLDGLYQKELPLYEKMAKRTYSVVAAEYVETFKKFLENN